MPLYEYRCLKCSRRVEKIENLNGPHLKKCPHCGGKVEPVLSAPAIQFKGSGWYVTDYARKSSGGDSSNAEKGEKTEKVGKAEKSDSKPAVAKEEKKTGSAKKEK